MNNVYLLVCLDSELDLDEQIAPRVFSSKLAAEEAWHDEMTSQLDELESIDDFDIYEENVVFSIAGYRVEIIEAEVE